MRLMHRPVILALLTGLLALPLVGAVPAGALASVPVLASPTDGATVSANPVLEWQAAPGAARYRVQVSTSPGFSAPVANVVTFNTKYTLATDLAQATHWWRVAAVDSGGLESGFGEVRSFVKEAGAAPVPTNPAEGQIIAFPEEPAQFSWIPMAGAKSYDIEIDDDPAFTPPVKIAANTANASYTLTEPLTIGQTFYWRIRAKSGTNLPTQFSLPRSFGVSWPDGAPALTYPPDQVTPAIEEVLLDWEPVLGAQSYDVEVSRNQDFTGPLEVDIVVRSSTYSPPTTLLNSAYFWRVRAINAAGGIGPFSSIRTFTKDWPPDLPPFNRVTLLTPADGDFEVTVPTFSWTPVRLAARYELQMSVEPTFSPANVRNCFTNHTTVTPNNACGVDPNPGQVYYWRVRPIDDPTAVFGPFSQTFSFQYFPILVAQTGPANGTVTSAPVLTWDKPEGDIAKFRVTVYRDPDYPQNPGTLLQTADTINDSYSPTGLARGTSYGWKVQTIDAQGRVGPLPATFRTFTLIDPIATFPLPTPTSLPGVSGIYPPALTWLPVTGAERYEIWIAPLGSGIFTRLTNAPTLPAYSHTLGDLAVGAWEWYVKAIDDQGPDPEGLHSTFAIEDLRPCSDYPFGCLPATNLTAPPHCSPLIPCGNLLDTPTLKWDPVPRAGWYIVNFATDANFTNITKTYKTQYPTLTPQESLLDSQAGQATYWYARPCHAKSEIHCGPGPSTFVDEVPSPVRAFRKQSNAVQLVSPDNGATKADEFPFEWTDFLETNGGNLVTQEARSYRIQVSTAADFSTLLDEKVVDQTKYTAFDRTYPEGPIYWRVQAIDGSINPLTWSAARMLIKQSPGLTLLSPAAGAAVNGVPQFRWAAQAHAARYEVEVYKNPGDPINVSNRVLTVQTKQAAWAPVATLPAGTYGWRVRRLDGHSLAGPWTASTNAELRRFSFAGAAATLAGPVPGAAFTDDTLLFQWVPVEGAAQYRLETSTTSAFTPLRESQVTVMNAWAPTSDYLDGTYHWRVVTLDGSGNALATSEVRAFTKSPPPPPPPPPALPGPPATPPPAGPGPTLGPAGARSGYWMITAAGKVYPFGDAKDYGSQNTPAQDIEPTPSGNGYWILNVHGEVFPKGDARPFGRATLIPGEQATSLSATPKGDGYWIFTTKGRVIALGAAPFKGDLSRITLNGDVLDSVATPSGDGYYMVGSDGGIFTFGDANFAGSMGATKLNQPVVSMAPDPKGNGYWLVASDGGIFAFGPPFHGSTGHLTLNKPVTGMVTGDAGYLMVAEDGGIFAFGDAKFHGSLGANPPATPVASVALLR